MNDGGGSLVVEGFDGSVEGFGAVAVVETFLHFAFDVAADFGLENLNGFNSEGLREFVVDFRVVRSFDAHAFELKLSFLAGEFLVAVVFREGKREGLLLAGSHARGGIFEFGEHAALTEHEAEAFGLAALEFFAVDRAGEVDRQTVFSGSLAAFFLREGDALLDDRVDRLVDGFVVDRAEVALEFNGREVRQNDIGINLEAHFEAKVLAAFGRSERLGVELADNTVLTIAHGLVGFAFEQRVDDFGGSLLTVHGLNHGKRHMARTEARHLGPLGKATQFLGHAVLEFLAVDRHFKSAQIRVDGFFLLFGSGFLGSGNSLFFLNGFFSLHSFLIFGHCFFFLKAPETSANRREQSADSRLKIRYKRAKKRP